jgi:putative hydrolase of the HAD superfamily
LPVQVREANSGGMFRAIFFDAAGTLFEPREPVGESYARIARGYGVETTGAVVGQAFRDAFHESRGLAFGPGRSEAELRRMEREWWRGIVAASFKRLGSFNDFDDYFDALFAYFADPASWMADPNAAPLLNKLKQQGYRLGVVSNFDYRLYGILDGLGLSGFFDSITLSPEAGWAKPDPRIFEAALARYRIGPGEALHVGDSVHLDVAGAQAAGIAVVLLDPAAPVSPAYEGRSATVNSLTKVIEAMRTLSSR